MAWTPAHWRSCSVLLQLPMRATNAQAMNYPLLISAAGIICCLLTTFIATDLRPARMVSEIENTLKYQLIISTLLATPVRPPGPSRAARCAAPAVTPAAHLVIFLGGKPAPPIVSLS